MVKIDTSIFEKRHGELPSGKGRWKFVDETGRLEYEEYGDYDKVCQSAKAIYSQLKDTPTGTFTLSP